MSALQVRFVRVHPNAKMPTYATDGSGAFDLYAAYAVGEEDGAVLDISPGYPASFSTGLVIEVPAGHGMFILSRSGHGAKFAARLANCVGLVDSDYRGEVIVAMAADKQRHIINPPSLRVRPGDRIAQAVILPLPKVEFVEAETLSETDRGAGGFGSTGQS